MIGSVIRDKRGEDEEEGSEMTDKSDLAARAFWPSGLANYVLLSLSLSWLLILSWSLSWLIILVIIFPYYDYPSHYIGY